ncbi:MAG TPA: hypothetical protein VEG24_03055 [Gaiellaceae bacterium]|nr:hypothetical protein [Gaiellaceae bacterium]
MEWPKEFYELRRGRAGRSPEDEPGAIDEDELRRDVEALRG